MIRFRNDSAARFAVAVQDLQFGDELAKSESENDDYETENLSHRRRRHCSPRLLYFSFRSNDAEEHRTLGFGFAYRERISKSHKQSTAAFSRNGFGGRSKEQNIHHFGKGSDARF
jgi:hypothetical protein